jgi:hypothetical protein
VANASGLRAGLIIPVVGSAMIILILLLIKRRGQVSTINK